MKNIIVMKPATNRPSTIPLLLALHGNLSTAEASLGYWRPAVSAGWLLAMPQATRVDEDGQFIWNHPGRNDWPVEEIKTHYENLLDQYPIDTGNVVLGGFSMGAGLAAWLALHGHIHARGFILVSPYLPYKYVEAPEMDIVTPNNLRGYVVAGGLDDPIPEFSARFAERLRKENIPCELNIYPNMEHEYPPDFDALLVSELRSLNKQ